MTWKTPNISIAKIILNAQKRIRKGDTMVIHVNQIPKGLRRLFFWRKPPAATVAPPARTTVVLDLPLEKVSQGVYYFIGPDGPEEIEHFSALGKLDRDVTIKHEAWEDHRGRRTWYIKFGVTYNAGSMHYGNIGSDLVDQVGLIFPNVATPYADDVRHQGAGITWKTNFLPEPFQIKEVIQEVQRQVSEIMLDYQRAEAIRIVRERKK